MMQIISQNITCSLSLRSRPTAHTPKAIVLCAGDKTGVNQKRFYQSMIKLADKEYKQHLEELTNGKT